MPNDSLQNTRKDLDMSTHAVSKFILETSLSLNKQWLEAEEHLTGNLDPECFSNARRNLPIFVDSGSGCSQSLRGTGRAIAGNERNRSYVNIMRICVQ